MKAVTYQGIKDVQVKEVEDPKIEKQDDIIVRLTSTAICGSDLHLVHGMIPNLPKNYVIGHEPIGIVEEVGRDVVKLKKVIASSFRLMCPVGNASTAKITWKVSVIIRIQRVKLEAFLAIPRHLGIM